MSSLIVLALAGCIFGGGKDDDDTGAPVDPFVAAYAGCSRTAETVEDGEIIVQGLNTWDENGDEVTEHIEYTRSGNTVDLTVEYQAPHERSLSETVWSDGTPDAIGTFEWANGQIVHEEWNWDDDRAIDYVEDKTYDGFLQTGIDTDSDGDGVVDSELRITWTADGAEYVGAIEIELVDDSATGELRADAKGRLLVQEMAYASGTDISAFWSGYSAVDNVEIEDVTYSVLGESDDNTRREYVLDALGRVSSYTYVRTVAEAGEQPDVTATEITFTYDCP